MPDRDDYDYLLPHESIAQERTHPPEHARLLVLDRTTGKLIHRHVGDLPSLLSPTDILVINNTKVFNARLNGRVRLTSGSQKNVEVFLVRPLESGDEKSRWQAIGKPGKFLLPESMVTVTPNFSGVIHNKNDDGTFELTFPFSKHMVIEKANQYGSVPIPPYIKKIPEDGAYQTAYAKVTGSVAAPTAGFHLTQSLMQTLKKKGITIVEITLHVGLGTFLPIKAKTLEEHVMHSEWVETSQDAADTINQAKESGRRVVAVGTTTTRALEGAVIKSSKFKVQNSKFGSARILEPYTGDVDVFIKPGFPFRVIDALLTNFHLPKSTLLVLVSAFAGRERIMKAYKEAIEKRYRFYSFGDAMLIL